MRLRVDVQQASADTRVPAASELRRWARAAALAADAPAPAELTLRVVDEEEGAALNAAYRHGDAATNVLSFAFEASAQTEPPLLGDVVICAPVVWREAVEQGKPDRAHFAHMVVHGVLHLLGYRHEQDEDALLMEALEREVLAGLGFDDPYRGAQP